MNAAVKGTLPSSRISPLGRRGKVPKCEPQTPRTAAAGERRTGWSGEAPKDGPCMTGQKSQEAGDETLLLSHLGSAMQVLSHRRVPDCFDQSSGDDQPLSHPLLMLPLDSHSPQLLHVLQEMFSCSSPGRWKEPAPLSLVRTRT